MNHDAFISYSSKDAKVTQIVCKLLEQNGVKCWMAPRDVQTGVDYATLIEHAILHCKVFILIFSKDSANSKWVSGEVNVAFNENKIFLPLRLDDTPLVGGMRVILNDKHWIDATSNTKEQILVYVKDVIRAVQEKEQTISYEAKDFSKLKGKSHQTKLIIGISGAVVLIGVLLFFMLKPDKPQQMQENQPQMSDTTRLVLNNDTVLPEEKPAKAADSSTIKPSYKNINIPMVTITGGTFQMGDDLYGPAHSVTLNTYHIGKYEITQQIWEEVMGNNPSTHVGSDLPVENVSWADIQEFLAKLNKITGKHYRLPTEAEWEYAALGAELSGGWYNANSGGRTHAVGGKSANSKGLFDFLGNVSEWCADGFGKYTTNAQTNPKSNGTYKVIRGGAWDSGNAQCTPKYRTSGVAEYKSDNLGFRVAL